MAVIIQNQVNWNQVIFFINKGPDTKYENKKNNMKIKPTFFLLLILLGSCKNATKSEESLAQNNNIVIANQFINAFYSFNKDSLSAILSEANESRPGILFYQNWAECGNYGVLNRAEVIVKNDTLVVCPVTVRDDLIQALQLDMHVTDTFHLGIIDGHIKSVETSSNDPELFHEARKWVRENLAELVEEPCKRDKENGPTPCECVKATVQGFKEFIATKK